MDFSVTSATSYLPAQNYAQQASVRSNGGTDAQSRDAGASSADNRAPSTDRTELSPASLEAQKAREEAARRQDPAAEVSSTPGFSFEYEGNRQVMKVHNAKGVLIYQVPSKGQLALIQAEDSAQEGSSQLRLTA